MKKRQLLDLGTHHCLKRLREICDLNQQEFADKVGISKGSVISIETGAMKLSQSFARRIASVLNVSSFSLIDRNGQPMVAAPLEGPYTKAHYEQTSRAEFSTEQHPFDEAITAKSSPTRLISRLFYAAHSMNLYGAVYIDLCEWISTMLIEFPQLADMFFELATDPVRGEEKPDPKDLTLLDGGALVANLLLAKAYEKRDHDNGPLPKTPEKQMAEFQRRKRANKRLLENVIVPARTTRILWEKWEKRRNKTTPEQAVPAALQSEKPPKKLRRRIEVSSSAARRKGRD